MISLKKYLDQESVAAVAEDELPALNLLEAVLTAYRSALLEMGECSLEVCPGLGDELKIHLRKLQEGLSVTMRPQAMQIIEKHAQDQLEQWGLRVARHYREKADEVRELLLTVARTAESVGARDQRCVGQMHAVTDRLRAIASLEDVTEIRASIEKSAAELRNSIQRMSDEGKEAVQQLRKKVSTYEAKLEAAEELASRDALTKVRSRPYVECQIQRRIAAQTVFCVAVVDLDGFKMVNDVHGHIVGDEALKQFAAELKSACRSSDIIGRWGGDEFLIVFDCELAEAGERVERARKWVCGSYTIPSASGQKKVNLNASIGLARCAPNETMSELLSRADAEMYAQKDGARVALQ